MASNRAGGSKGNTTGKAGTKARSSTGKAGAKAKSAKGTKAPVQEARTGRDAVLERGDVFFFYRPNLDETSPGGILDVRRFHVVLRPEGGDVLRMITVGRKTLPETGGEGDGQNHWGFVDRIFRSPDDLREALSGATYETDTVGERELPPARPAGEGVYALVRHGRGTVLAYALELPEEPGEVQRAFHIEAEGRYVLSIKNPEVGSPSGIGLDGDRKVDFPEPLRERFGDRRWLPADPPEFLDHEGAEFVLIGGRVEADADLGIDLEPQPEDEKSAEVFKDLHLEKSERTIKPLFEGTWE